MKKLAVAFNDDVHLKKHLSDIERIGEEEVGEAAREIADLLGATLVPVRDDLFAALTTLRTFDLVFNLCEGVLGKPRFEMHFALALEMLGIPFTGCDPIAVALCTDKRRVKGLLRAAGIRTPEEYVARPEAGGRAAQYIVKPSIEDAGVGIDASSVVSSRQELEARCRFIEETYRQPALVEEFIDGAELNQAMYCGRILPPGEIVFADHFRPEERIVGWKAKWASGSAEDRGTTNRTPARVSEHTREAIVNLCLRATRVLGLETGYCRFDLRQSAAGDLYIIDINPNPDIGPGSGFRKALEAAGIGFRDFLDELMMSAVRRASLLP